MTEDVYKRQGLAWESISTAMIQNCWKKCSFEPVSYTHLDVYKRQSYG